MRKLDQSSPISERPDAVNGFKTMLLLSALTALFMGLGYFFGGVNGALIALIIAAGMNLLTY